ncbi:hypothetical protein BT96DRAFT_986463 [Gymnopus androsaceus JB14]|uniref:Uncharacterized protein n=1 Tax=Gymnopus androsaceus JB14 TaxID=1447944 RepID=A0A6A4ICE7_9AGAR|nr:hypothetical protein BT96DRAFT_986463 [Gymnopus androsaceus JB14]
MPSDPGTRYFEGLAYAYPQCPWLVSTIKSGLTRPLLIFFHGPTNAAIYRHTWPSAFDHCIFEDPEATILATPSDPEANAFIIEGRVIPASSTYPACLAEWYPTHPQADFTFAAHCFFLAHTLRFETRVGTDDEGDLPTALAEFMIHLEPSLNYIFMNWIARANCPTFAVFRFCLAFAFLANHTFPHFHTYWLDPLNPGDDFLQVVQTCIQELGVTTAMPTPIPFDPSTAEGCHLALLIPPQDLKVFPPLLLAPRNIVSLVYVPPPLKSTASMGTLPASPKVTRSAPNFEGRPHKVAPKQPLVLLKSTRHAAASKSTRSTSKSSANDDTNEEEDELKHSPPKRSTTSCKCHCLPSMASSKSSEVSSPKSEAPIAKKIPVTRSTIAKANLASNPKGKQKACACSKSVEISAPKACSKLKTKAIGKEEQKPATRVKKNGKKDNLEDFPSLQVNSKGLNNMLPPNLQVPFFNIKPSLSDLGVVLTHNHVGYTLEELQLVNRPLDLLGSELVSCIPCQIRNVKCSPNTERLGGKCAPCITSKQPCNLGCGMAEYLEGLDRMYWHLDQCPANILSEAQCLHVIHGHAITISHHHQELIRQVEYDFLATMARLQSAGSDAAIVLHQLVQSALEHVCLSLDNLSFLATVFRWNSIFNLPDLLASLEVRDHLLHVGKEDEPGGTPVDSSSSEPSGSGSVQVPDAVASGAEANTQADASASLIVPSDALGQVTGPSSAVPDSRDTAV